MSIKIVSYRFYGFVRSYKSPILQCRGNYNNSEFLKAQTIVYGLKSFRSNYTKCAIFHSYCTKYIKTKAYST